MEISRNIPREIPQGELNPLHTYIKFKGAISHIACRILQEKDTTVAQPLKANEVALWVKVSGKPKRIALQIQHLKTHLSISESQFRKAEERGSLSDLLSPQAFMLSDQQQVSQIQVTAKQLNLSPVDIKAIIDLAKRTNISADATVLYRLGNNVTYDFQTTAGKSEQVRDQELLKKLEQQGFRVVVGKNKDEAAALPQIFIIAKQLGKGAEAEVFLCYDVKDNCFKAIKKAKSSELSERIQQEGDVLAKLNTWGPQLPGIAGRPTTISTIQESAAQERGIFVGQLYEGTLFDYIQQENRPFAQTNNMIAELLRGLQTLFKNNFAPADIKETNILIKGQHAYHADLPNVSISDSTEQVMQKAETIRNSSKTNQEKKDAYLSLLGSYSPYTPQYQRDEDWYAQLDAIENGDRQTFESIEKGKAIYSLGLTILYLLNPDFRRFAMRPLPPEALSSKKAQLDFMKQNLPNLSQNVPFILSSLTRFGNISETQMKVIQQMVHEDWKKRPSISKAVQAFPLLIAPEPPPSQTTPISPSSPSPM